MGYTPAFDDIYMGTLYGKWPAAAVWATLLPLIDSKGRIDMSIQAIAGMTGWPLELLTEGIRQLMEPDPGSRTPDADGRRLLPIDSSRPWGWIAVNHGKYRERARKQAYDSWRTASGHDANRKREKRLGDPERQEIYDRDGGLCGICATPLDYESAHLDHITPTSKGGSDDFENKQLTHSKCNQGKSGGDNRVPWRHPSMGSASREVPRSPAKSRSHTQTHTQTQTEEEEDVRSRARTATHLPDDFELTDERRKVATTEGLDAERTFAKFCNFWRAASGQRARKRSWDAAWRYWCQNDRSGVGNGTRKPISQPRPSAVERVRQATERFVNGDEEARGGGVVIDG